MYQFCVYVTELERAAQRILQYVNNFSTYAPSVYIEKDEAGRAVKYSIFATSSKKIPVGDIKMMAGTAHGIEWGLKHSDDLVRSVTTYTQRDVHGSIISTGI